MDTDRNLLFGVLALQADVITAEQFLEACSAWAARKGTPLPDVLAARGWITAAERATIEHLMRMKLARHGGDAHASLAAAADDSARRALAGIGDVEVDATICRLPEPAGHVLVSTIGHQAETRDRYTLTRLHAQGGIGRVWLARDSALGREVALKELRPERAGHPAAWSRFLEEARITGQLEHPGIVPVYELSQHADDRQPFYTMRFVRGRTLSEAIRAYHTRRQAGTAGPIELNNLLIASVGVCNAVAYAHSRGVIHRDLKGQNVVLGDYGEVMVLDWGLAKLVDRPEPAAVQPEAPPVALAPEAGHEPTIQGQALGTPAYMSPEQAEGRLDQIDARSDVYGLGAILYEVLAGRPPFAGDDTADLLRRVALEPPAPPRLANPAAPAALEAVCLKALSKRPGDRYASAGELAEEVRRFLADEPVSAHREPWAARLARWGRRHRTLAASLAAALLCAVVALGAGTLLLSRANARIEAERLRAEEGFQKARQAVDAYYTKVSESDLLNVPGLQPLRRDLLDSARRYYEQFLRDQGDDPAVRAEAAEAWYRVGFVVMEIGDRRDAARDFTRAAAMYEALARDHPNEVRYLYKQAMSLNDLGNQQSALGQRDEALRTHQRALTLRERLSENHPGYPEYLKELAISYSNLADCQFNRGELTRAIDTERKAQAIYEGLIRDNPHHSGLADYRDRLAGVYNSLGYYLHDTGRVDESLALHGRAVDLLQRLTAEHPEVLEYRSHLADSFSEIGFLQYRLLDEPTKARENYERAREILESLAKENPTVRAYRFDLGYCMNHLGRILEALGRPEEALAAHQRALGLREALANDQPEVPWFGNAAAYSHYYIGRLRRAAGDEVEAARSLARAREIWAAAVETDDFDLYNRACHLALCSELEPLGADPADGGVRGRSERYAERAVATLRQAADGGYANARMIELDSDFDSVRDRDDYRSLLADLKARPAEAGPAEVPPAIADR